MADPSFEVIRAMIARLRSAATLTSLGVTGVYDPPPQPDAPVVPPYISLGPSDVYREDASCVSGQGIFIQLDVWSWGAGKAGSSVLTREICDAVEQLLHDQEMALPTNLLSTLEHRSTEIMRDRGGIVNHGIVRFWASVQRA